ncbi:unnamed protein product, partial [Didymodactylos carnosus]
MGQTLSATNSQFTDLLTLAQSNYADSDVFATADSDINFFLPLKTDGNRDKDAEGKELNEATIITTTLIKQIRTHLFTLTNLQQFNALNTQITTDIQQIVDGINSTNTTTNTTITTILEKQKQLQSAYALKLANDKSEINLANTSIFSHPFIDSTIYSGTKIEIETAKQNAFQRFQTQQLSYFALQSLLSVLLVLIKSVHNTDSTIIYQILTMTKQFIEQIPAKYLASENFKQSSLFTSLKPLSNYIEELSIQTVDLTAKKQAIEILLRFAVAKASFTELLHLIARLVFNTDNINIYDVRGLILQLNEDLSSATNKSQDDGLNAVDLSEQAAILSNMTTIKTKETQTNREPITIACFLTNPLEYLQIINVLPNTSLMTLDESQFSPIFLASVLLAHIDFHHEMNSKYAFETNSLNNSFSFTLHSDTFKQLFDIIQSLSITQLSHHTAYILVVCLRLFTTHLKFLIKSALDTTEFVSNKELHQWKEFMFRLSTENEIRTIDDNQSLYKEIRTIVCTEASKAFIYLLEKLTPKLIDKLQFIYQYIIDNKYPILIQQLLINLHNNVTLKTWIELLSYGKLKQEMNNEEEIDE